MLPPLPGWVTRATTDRRHPSRAETAREVISRLVTAGDCADGHRWAVGSDSCSASHPSCRMVKGLVPAHRRCLSAKFDHGATQQSANDRREVSSDRRQIAGIEPCSDHGTSTSSALLETLVARLIGLQIITTGRWPVDRQQRRVQIRRRRRLYPRRLEVVSTAESEAQASRAGPSSLPVKRSRPRSLRSASRLNPAAAPNCRSGMPAPRHHGQPVDRRLQYVMRGSPSSAYAELAATTTSTSMMIRLSARQPARCRRARK